MRLKVALLHCLKVVGIFAACRALTRSKLRILCYHGFSIGDQHRYNPMLFMTEETFRRRMRLLQKMGYPVVSLADGLQSLRRDAVRNCETVITIDDGWRTTETIAAPILQSAGYPTTIYVTTYNCERDVEVFTVALNYLLWRTRTALLTVQDMHPAVDGTYSASSSAELADELIGRAEAHLDAQQRQRFLQRIAQQLDSAAAAELVDGRFRLMTPHSVAAMARAGFDIQLHTHRHRLSMTDEQEVRREISDNRERLEAWTGLSPRHFCYPSGKCAPQHARWLQAVDVESATTCEPGLNDASSGAYALSRFLDSEAISDIEFEAELAGVGDLMRSLKASLAR